MEIICSFRKLVGGVCAFDKRYEGAVVVPLSSCDRDVLGLPVVLKSTISTQKLNLFWRAHQYSRFLSTWTICPAHRSSLGIGWRRGANRCCVPPELSKHASKGKSRKADRGIGKSESKAILQRTGVFVPVGSGKNTFCLPYCCAV